MTGNETVKLFESMRALNGAGIIWKLRRCRDKKIVAVRYFVAGLPGSWCWARSWHWTQQHEPKEQFWLDDADKWWKDKTGRRGVRVEHDHRGILNVASLTGNVGVSGPPTVQLYKAHPLLQLLAKQSPQTRRRKTSI